MRLKSKVYLTIYSILTTLLAPVGLLYLCYKKRKDPPYGHRVWELLGHYEQNLNTCIWFHTVSVGEVIAARPVINNFIKRNLNLNVIVTTTTTTGAIEAEKISGITHVFAPLDSMHAVEGFIQSFNPSHVFIMETELWPNMLHVCKKHKVQTYVFNARMPEKTCKAYEKRLSVVKDLIADNLDGVICQSQADADRFIRIGVKPEKLVVASSLKYDLHPNETLFSYSRAIKRIWQDSLILGAISTHEGEEEQILETFYNLRRSYPSLRLVLVPRHQSGVTRAQHFLEQINGNYQLRTVVERDLSNFNAEILIGNTMGEIEFYLGLCDLIFMGGSLIDRGGHNPLEPAFFSLPIITGPYYYNFQEQYDKLIEQRGAYIANDHLRLYNVCKMFFDDPQLMLTTGMQALDVQQEGKGALETTIKFLESALKSKIQK